MCDTIIATASKTKNSSMILAKNSDREVNEAQVITWVPPTDHKINTKVQCTFIDIPQAAHTHGVFLSRPFWMFGAEMGVNDQGVAIANEAVFTKEPYSKSGLTGMDLLRLALERSASAIDAIKTISSLLETYDQGGNCAMEGSLFYHNSYIISDAEEAYIMETAGKHWVSKKVENFGAISNILSIEDDFDLSSSNLSDFALKKKYIKKKEKVNFRKAFKDTIYSHFAQGDIRRECNLNNLASKENITSQDMAPWLRNHNEDEPMNPSKRYMKKVCIHGGGLISSQSTGSMIAELKKGYPPIVWFTGTSAPCMSFFKPWTFPAKGSITETSFSTKNPQGGIDIYGSPGKTAEKKSLWWICEDIHRTVLPRYKESISIVRNMRRDIEEKAFSEIDSMWNKKDMKELEKKCITLNEQILTKTLSTHDAVISHIKDNKIKKEGSLIFNMKWKSYNRKSQWKDPSLD